MKKFVTIFGVVLAALALAGIAWAATAEGKLTGDFKWNTPGRGRSKGRSNGIHAISTTQPGGAPILDGETLYVNQNNDPSGDCNGDSGTITVQYDDSTAGRIRITTSSARTFRTDKSDDFRLLRHPLQQVSHRLGRLTGSRRTRPRSLGSA